jgi:hypothetical protein
MIPSGSEAFKLELDLYHQQPQFYSLEYRLSYSTGFWHSPACRWLILGLDLHNQGSQYPWCMDVCMYVCIYLLSIYLSIVYPLSITYLSMIYLHIYLPTYLTYLSTYLTYQLCFSKQHWLFYSENITSVSFVVRDVFSPKSISKISFS